MDEHVSRSAVLASVLREDPRLAYAVTRVPAADAVARSAYSQVVWERDTALSQLAEIGKGLGEKMDDVPTVVFCRECENYNPEGHYDRGYDTCFMTVIRKDGAVISGSQFMPADGFCSFGKRRSD